jgi:hypothetical protein
VQEGARDNIIKNNTVHSIKKWRAALAGPDDNDVSGNRISN